ncbi:hypothetical protein NXS19_008430 [Fusarium pseudograminearum]|nr:hypothetical protein NXS19_008430 [Fusarium pseudograminearum]
METVLSFISRHRCLTSVLSSRRLFCGSFGAIGFFSLPRNRFIDAYARLSIITTTSQIQHAGNKPRAMAWQANGRYRPNDVTTWKSELCMPRHANLAKSSVDKKITEKVQSKLWCVLGSMGVWFSSIQRWYTVLYSLARLTSVHFMGQCAEQLGCRNAPPWTALSLTASPVTLSKASSKALTKPQTPDDIS